MTALPENTDPIPYASFLVSRLFRDCGAGKAGRMRAMLETEKPIDGDIWAWSDDNAKVLELFSRPEISARFPEATASILQFLREMCDGPFIFRRIGRPRLERVEDFGQAGGRWLHTLMHVTAKLDAGILNLGIRFHDGRTAINLYLTGNYVQFKFGNDVITIDVEDAIDRVSVDDRDGRLLVTHSGELHFATAAGRRTLGRVNYTYRIDQRSMLVRVEASLDLDPAIEVSDVILTIGHDDLSHGKNNVHYAGIGVLQSNGNATWHAESDPGESVIPAQGAPYYSFAQDEMPGFALGIHTRPLSPERLMELRVVRKAKGELHWVVAAYKFARPARGERLAVAEDKLLTAGGFYGELAAYERLMAEATTSQIDSWPRDFSISYDYGVEINAFAKCFATLKDGPNPRDRQLAGELRQLTDRYLEVYEYGFVAGSGTRASAVFSRQLAFVILAVATMLRATGEKQYRHKLRELVDILLQFEVVLPAPPAGPEGAFLMGLQSNRAIYVDCHSAALLALVHAAPWLDDPRIAGALDRGINAFELISETMDMHRMRKVDTIGLRWPDDGGQIRVNHAFWNYQAGLTLRLFRALRTTTNRPLRDVAVFHEDRLRVFEPLLRQQIALGTRQHAEGPEILSSWAAGETNSETQPWVVLGLVGHPWD